MKCQSIQKKILALSLCGLLGAFASTNAQTINAPKCGHKFVMDHYEKQFPGYKQMQDELFKESQLLAQNTASKGTATVHRIPVVFHVIYNNAAQNLHDSVLLNQLNVLNGAYRKKHSDTSKTRAIFKPLSGDSEIEFYLATKDPNGNPSTGITRTSYNQNTFGSLGMLGGDLSNVEKCKSTASGGKDPWPSTKYLNIWVVNMEIPGFGPAILGYATPPVNPLPGNWPPNSGIETLGDGVVLQYHTVGNNNPHVGVLAGMADKGRTAVHEVGHYLGLRHIGGDETNCAITSDGIDDTPRMNQSDQQSDPSCANVTKNTCGSGPTDTVDMWENYMDYSYEGCQNMFTKGQIALMRMVVENQRKTLAVKDVEYNTNFTIYPNPATNNLYFDFPKQVNKAVVRNIMGQIELEIPASQLASREINTSTLSTGMHFLELHTKEGISSQKFIKK